MSKSDDHSTGPKSLRQRRILDLAAEEPGASFAEIAERVPSATADLVERVLEEYGDPAASEETSTIDSTAGATSGPADEQASEESPEQNGTASAQSPPSTASEGSTSAHSPTNSDDTPPASLSNAQSIQPEQADDGGTPDPTAEDQQSGSPASEPATDRDMENAPADGDGSAESDPGAFDPDTLSAKERETVRAIYAHPSATQREIAETLGLSRATVSNRIRGIDGFDWADRQSLVEEMFGENGGDESPARSGQETPESHETRDAVGADPPSGSDGRAIADGSSSDGPPSDADPEVSPATESVSDRESVPDSGSGSNPAGDPRSQASGADSASTAESDASEGPDPPDDGGEPGDVPHMADSIEELSSRLATIERRVEAVALEADGESVVSRSESASEPSPDPAAASDSSPASESSSAPGSASDAESVFDDPRLAHKIIRACVHDDDVTEEEERRVVAELLNG